MKKKSIAIICVALASLSPIVKAQTFSSLVGAAMWQTNNPATIIWNTSNYGSGFGHKIYDADNNGKTYLKIAARHNSGVWTDAVTVTSDGLVGIGTTSPLSKLHVYGGYAHMTYNSYNQALPASDEGLTVGWNRIGTEVDFYNVYDNAARSFVFSQKTGASTVSDLMIINGNGNVGIGTNAPTAQLHLSSNNDHDFLMTRNDGAYGFRIHRDAANGVVHFQIGNGYSSGTVWETKIHVGEGEGANTKLLLNPTGGRLYVGAHKVLSTHIHANSDYQFDGKIACKELVVLDPTKWADYVFADDYKLKDLSEVEEYYTLHKHLPDVPSEKEVKENGISTVEMDATLLQKIEELTLYVVDLNKKVELLQTENKELKTQIGK